jgi:hypothetical protein
MLPLAVDAEDASCAAAFRFDAIEAAIATDIEHAFAGQVRRKTSLNYFPALARMIDGLAHHAFSLGEDSVAEIDSVEPGLEQLEAAQNFRARHKVLRMMAAASSAPVTSIRIKSRR